MVESAQVVVEAHAGSHRRQLFVPEIYWEAYSRSLKNNKGKMAAEVEVSAFTRVGMLWM